MRVLRWQVLLVLGVVLLGSTQAEEDDFSEDEEDTSVQDGGMVFETKPGRGGCPDKELLGHENGIKSLEAAKAKCEEKKCAYFTWSDDPNEAYHGLWMCAVDYYSDVPDDDQWRRWVVARGRKVVKSTGPSLPVEEVPPPDEDEWVSDNFNLIRPEFKDALNRNLSKLNDSSVFRCYLSVLHSMPSNQVSSKEYSAGLLKQWFGTEHYYNHSALVVVMVDSQEVQIAVGPKANKKIKSKMKQIKEKAESMLVKGQLEEALRFSISKTRKELVRKKNYFKKVMRWCLYLTPVVLIIGLIVWCVRSGGEDDDEDYYADKMPSGRSSMDMDGDPLYNPRGAATHRKGNEYSDY